MRDVTKDIMTTEFCRQNGRLNSYTRLDFLLQRLQTISALLDQTQRLRICVMDSDGCQIELIYGKLREARDLISIYDATHMMTLSVNRQQNAVIRHLEKLKDTGETITPKLWQTEADTLATRKEYSSCKCAPYVTRSRPWKM